MPDHYRMQLADIAAARARKQRGQYGNCIDCQQPIPFSRLQAYPTAKRCTACQRRHEIFMCDSRGGRSGRQATEPGRIGLPGCHSGNEACRAVAGRLALAG
ncbi:MULTISPECIES: TraR/DksA C4-type zinc finger protein [unclassified Cupriavidus]|uniref:TraR/DksA family transcriptional regulator n=1 Tax=unclassified Cupriavidus TaxID=2640874 RepID=UPI0032AF40A5